MKVLFLSTRPDKPSYRFRVVPFLGPLTEGGWAVESAFVPRSWWARRRLWRRLAGFDAVVVQKKLFGWLDLRSIRRGSRRLLYDLDDAIMYRSDEGGTDDPRREARFRAMVGAADLVMAGNEFLASEVRAAGGRVAVVPTVVDTDLYRPAPRGDGGPVTIGWSGSSSTNRYLVELLASLGRFEASRPWRLLVVSNARPETPFPIVYEPWSDERELALLQSFDVGIMPLDDTPWSRGKCGMKAILSQAVGAPVVCSPVGVNPEVVAEGETGFLVRTPEEWADRLRRLVEDDALRRRLGEAARRRMVDRYSVRAVLPRLVECLASS